MRAGLLVIALLAAVVWGLVNFAHSGQSAGDISPDHQVVIFTAPWCGFCDQARAHLERRRIDFLEIDIEGSAEANSRWRDAGGRGVPLTYIGQQRLAGYSAPVFDQALDRL